MSWLTDFYKYKLTAGINQTIHSYSSTPGTTYVVANSGITWTAADNGSGKVRLTSSGVHGITAGNGQGNSLYLISGGTGWTAGTSHVINASAGVVDTTHIDLDTAYTASMGVPVFALKGTIGAEATAEIVLKNITLPALGNNSSVILELLQEFSADADATGSRRTSLYLGSTQLFSQAVGTANSTNVPYRWGFRNQGATNSQRGTSANNSTGFNSSTAAINTAAIDTSVASTLSIRAMLNVTNMTVRVGSYDLLIRN